jgi:hypothetical protein
LVLYCPFCNAPEDERVSGIDGTGGSVVLLMFDCPFSLKMPQNLMSEKDTGIQKYLDDWRLKNGDAWLESVGPILKNRELRNIQKNMKRSSVA